MHFLVIENYPNTDLGILGREAAALGHSWNLVKAQDGDALPQDIAPYAGLVVLGGAQNALADDDYPHLPEACALIRAFHDKRKPVMGICLGSQLVARAFGGGNLLDRPIEFGWRDVVPTEAAEGDPVVNALGEGAPQFHWHSDTVTLPEGAVHLASSAMTPVQAFRLGQTTYALQFHFETGLQEVRSWSENFAADIAKHTPDWAERFEGEAKQHAKSADAVGAEISRAWLSML
ncbi:type 1 glutamine amidotransferase [Roseibium sp. M-1]